MKEIPKKNYYILALLVVLTIIVVLSLAKMYKSKNQLVSRFYSYAYKVTSEEFYEYSLENFDFIVYIADKYDLANEQFEKKFEQKIDSLNLKNKLIYIDKKELNKKFLDKFYNQYGIRINLSNMPLIIVVIDKKVSNVTSVMQNSNVDTIIEYEDFE